MKTLKSHFFRKSVGKIFSVAIFCLHGVASAGVVTIGFDDVPAPSSLASISNFSTQHVLFSPSCHYHILNTVQLDAQPAFVPESGKWLGFDQSGCYPGQINYSGGYVNSDYLGPSGFEESIAKMFVALEYGGEFSIKSLLFASLSGVGSYVITSSKGGVATISADAGNFALHGFAGDKWTDIGWLEFVRIGGSDIPWGFDNLALESAALPEPTSVALVVVALAAIGGSKRRRLL